MSSEGVKRFFATRQDGVEVECVDSDEYAALEAECERLRASAGALAEFTQQMARQQGEPYFQRLAKAALKNWSGS